MFAELAAHYPDRLAGVQVVNSSRCVALVYKALVAPFLTDQTRAKINFAKAQPEPQAAASKGGSCDGGSRAGATSPEFDPVAYMARDL